MPRRDMRDSMALTPESLMEQQMQPLASSSHSWVSWPSWVTVRAFSMSAAAWGLCQEGLVDEMLEGGIQSPNSSWY